MEYYKSLKLGIC